ncbi:hypothetical protein DKM44_13690 [Deinococcus irradiatisoli]|uniref:Uncharacterized protein n=1 Tax=Deinococcus irradiatisoli TaxID=2202254 RepID=A0A2Z3JMY4_9DEIO|nr:hypothetical protein [Deinococcus irradiatisoli]AWN24149.1 hypothetical protein DKM44_13690 [Deinococcus irradiatisoli]
MKSLWCLLLAASSLAAAQPYEMKSYLNFGGWQPAAFWCDTPTRVLAVTQPASSDLPQPVKLVEWTGPNMTWNAYQLGRADPGAGQVYHALTPAGQPTSPNPAYFIHSSNIENTQDPAYRMTHINEFKVPSGRFGCRYKPQAAFLGATAHHSITVWEYGGKVTYSSTNKGGSGGVYLTGGSHTGQEYRWTNQGYTYLLTLGEPGATLSVLRGGKVLSREPFLAYSISVKP